MSPSRLPLWALALFTTSCVAPDPALDSVEQAAGCPNPLCGNAAKLFGPFYELDMTRTFFSELGRYRIRSVVHDGIELDLVVDGFTVSGYPKTGGAPLVNEALIDAVLVIEQQGNTSHAEVTIESVGSITYYEGGDDETTLPTFELQFEEVLPDGTHPNPPRPVCPSTSIEGLARHALLFTGTRYGASGGVIASGAETHPWFNVACQDTAQWKAAAFRLVTVASNAEYPSNPLDHAAAVRSIRADYCGDGIDHTELGTFVDWENRGGWLTKIDNLVIEALWDEHGATCLSTPRIASFDKTTLPCNQDLPLCKQKDLMFWKAHKRMATWVKKPPPSW